MATVPLLLALTACGEEPAEPSTDPATAPAAEEPAAEEPAAAAADGQEFTVSATVLESPGHGPVLCHAVMESLPPQCDGPDVAGWDWSQVTAEEASGTTWGLYQLTGTWDGERFTLTGPPAEPDPGAPEPAPDPEGLDLEPTGRSLAELQGIQQTLSEDFTGEILSSWIDEEFDVVHAETFLATDELRQTFADLFGGDAVVLHSWLQPAP